MPLDDREITRVRSELERRRKVLIGIARNAKSPIDQLDREEIRVYLEQGKLPLRPETVPDLSRAFFSSCFTYAVVRKFCVARFGQIPTRQTIGECLAVVFECESLRSDDTWKPVNLLNAAQQIQAKRAYNLDLKKPEPRMIRVLIDGSRQLSNELADGLVGFFRRWDQVTSEDADSVWNHLQSFSKPIRNVGPVLICDFLKEIGYAQFVKADHHFRREFPQLIEVADGCADLSDKEHFAVSQKLAARIGMTPFHLDKILYEWGRCGRFANFAV